MKLMISLLFMLSLCSLLSAQSTGFLDDFNDNTLNGWEVPQTTGTFTLTEADSVLRIDYNRTGESWEWDNFNFTPLEVIDVTANPYITVRVKSNVITELTFKPVYDQTEMDWIQYILPDDEEWHTYTFELSNDDPYYIDRIYMYLDGGTTELKSGTVWFDDMRIGDSVRTADILDLSDLQRLIADANKLHDNAVEGTGEGQFEPGSKAVLKAKIEEAEFFITQPDFEPSDLDSATWELADACVTFETLANASGLELVDNLATKETKYLYFNLDWFAYDYLFFGMHDATGYGVGWTGDDDRSDVKSVCGSYPAIYSEDFNDVVHRNNEIDRMRYRLTSAYNRGGIITLGWHQYDPEGRSFYAENVNYERIVETLLPGGEYHEFYKGSLYKIAYFLKTLRGANGESIPVIFRPYHEHTGGWFWWGVGHCTTNEYNQIWRFTAEYLRDSLNVHNLIYALSPSLTHLEDADDYFNIYPGDDYIDIMGTDHYLGNPPNKTVYTRNLKHVVAGSEERNKLVALTEIGNENLTDHDFFTDVVLNPILEDSVFQKISYAAVWRNQDEGHHFAPYPGHPSVPDFIEFYNHPYTVFEDNIPEMYVPATSDSSAPVLSNYPEEPYVAFYTEVEIQLTTDERAFLRYSFEDQPYAEMPYDFESGQGMWEHSTMIHGEQGEQYNLFIHARDYLGNTTAVPMEITFEIDTLQRPLRWSDRQYDASSWETALSPFVFEGNSGDGTPLNPVNTVYFRKPFLVQHPDSLFQYVVYLHYDNGAVVYLNGTEVARVNMPYGEITYETQASDDAETYTYMVLDKNDLKALVEGENILGVEVHQRNDDAEDLLFNLKIIDPTTVIDYGDEWYYFDEGTEPEIQILGSVGIENSLVTELKGFELYQNYPNPFNAETSIKYVVRSNNHTTLVDVNLSIFNLLGQKIATLVSEKQPAGIYTVRWNAKDVATGIYLYKLSVGKETRIRKMILLK